VTRAALTLLPAVDVAAGQSVRLVRGELDGAGSHGDPLAAASAWQRAGASWVHLVDLDASFGRGSNHELLASMVSHLDASVQLSGGIRDEDSLLAALSTGCARVNLSTAALLDPAWVAAAIAQHGDRVAVGLDVRGSRLVARGSGEDVGELSDALRRLEAAGCARYVVTDVARDGALSGPNLTLLRQVCERTSSPVVASGGIASLADVAALRDLVPYGVEAAIIGQALYTGGMHLVDALAVAGVQSSRGAEA